MPTLAPAYWLEKLISAARLPTSEWLSPKATTFVTGPADTPFAQQTMADQTASLTKEA